MNVKFYTDAHIPKQVASQLRLRGIAVIRCEEIGLAEADDMEAINHIEIRAGRGYIAGRNVKAEMVARMYVGTDYTVADVMEHYDLSAAEVHAAIAFYYDHRAELDARHTEAIQWAEENALTLEKFKAKIAVRK